MTGRTYDVQIETSPDGQPQITFLGQPIVIGHDLEYRAALALAARGLSGQMRVYRKGQRNAVGAAIPIPDWEQETIAEAAGNAQVPA
jgi:hypothetical protein